MPFNIIAYVVEIILLCALLACLYRTDTKLVMQQKILRETQLHAVRTVATVSNYLPSEGQASSTEGWPSYQANERLSLAKQVHSAHPEQSILSFENAEGKIISAESSQLCFEDTEGDDIWSSVWFG